MTSLNVDIFTLGFICGSLCLLPVSIGLHFVWLLLRYKPGKDER